MPSALDDRASAISTAMLIDWLKWNSACRDQRLSAMGCQIKRRLVEIIEVQWSAENARHSAHVARPVWRKTSSLASFLA
jgi:hypothetical protein